jgi:hypothetical protein
MRFASGSLKADALAESARRRRTTLSGDSCRRAIERASRVASRAAALSSAVSVSRLAGGVGRA